MSGEIQSASAPLIPQDFFRSVNLPIDARVPAKIRAKIWNNEFINFGSLLVNPVLDGKMQLTIQNAGSSDLPSFALEPISKPKKITTIDFCLTAFHIFVGVYTGKCPTEAPALMKYSEIV